jgi:hypothetical protein
MNAMLDSQTLKTVVQLACRAPSAHDSQPWRWVADDRFLRLFVDGDRSHWRTDGSSRQAIISCGAALDHLRVATLAAGWHAMVARIPDPNNHDHLASIEFAPAQHVTNAQRDRAKAILDRMTARLPMQEPTYWGFFEPVLRSAFDDNLVTLDVLSDDALPRLVKASQLSEAFHREDGSYQAELDWWTSPLALHGGVSGSAPASDRQRRRVGVARECPVKGQQYRRAECAADRSKILVLSTEGDTAAEALRCGEMLSTVLLECTMAFLATCTLTHLIEVAERRDIVRGLLDDGRAPQVLIRAGIASPMEAVGPPTPRRPASDVLKIA